jgi:hypothetical protein
MREQLFCAVYLHSYPDVLQTSFASIIIIRFPITYIFHMSLSFFYEDSCTSRWLLKAIPTTHHGGAWGERRCGSYSFLTSALVGVSWPLTPRPRFTPGTHWTGGWVDPRGRSGHRLEENPLPLPGIEPRSLRRPGCSQTLYWPTPAPNEKCLTFSGKREWRRPFRILVIVEMVYWF